MKVLLVTDGSSRAESALRFGAQITAKGSLPPTIFAVGQKSTQNLSSRMATHLERATELFQPYKETHLLIRTGDPFEQIIDEADQGAYDLVIMGDRRPGNTLQRFVFGSTAVRVAEYAPCSVLVVRGKVSKINRILLCDSGMAGSSLLGRLVVQLADILVGEEDVTVLHVMSQVSAGPGVNGKDLRAGAEDLIEEHSLEGQILERDIQILDKPGIHASPKVRHGLVVDEILAEARSGDYDLVVMGAHSFSGERHFLLDNIAHQILRSIDRPILVVRKRKDATP